MIEALIIASRLAWYVILTTIAILFVAAAWRLIRWALGWKGDE